MRDEFLAIIITDMLFAILSMLIVFGYIWFHTGSLFLALAGIAEILLSLPTAYFLYRAVLGFKVGR